MELLLVVAIAGVREAEAGRRRQTEGRDRVWYTVAG